MQIMGIAGVIIQVAAAGYLPSSLGPPSKAAGFGE